MAVKSSDVKMSLSTILEHFTDQFVLIIKKICKLDEWTYVRIGNKQKRAKFGRLFLSFIVFYE